MERYLSKCLDSFLVKEEYRDLLEIVVVNDGSTDMSSTIGHDYAYRYEGMYRIVDKGNGHYGSCINRALEVVSGKYVKIVDADDWVNTVALEHVLDSLRTLDADMVLTQYCTHDASSGKASISYSPTIAPYIVHPSEHMSYESVGVYVMHCIIYKTSFLASINYRQTEHIPYTDTEWVYKPISFLNTFVYLPEPLYCYLVGRDGQSMETNVLNRSIVHYSEIARQLISVDDHLPESFRRRFAYATTERQVAFLITAFYKTSLLQYSDCYDADALYSFDEYLKIVRPSLFYSLNKLKIKPYFPIHYVRFWRLWHFRFPVAALRRFYEMIKYGYRR